MMGEVGEGQHWSLGPFFLSAGATPIEVLGAFPASPSWWCLQRSWLRLHPSILPLSLCGLLHLLSVVSVSLIGMLVIGFR